MKAYLRDERGRGVVLRITAEGREETEALRAFEQQGEPWQHGFEMVMTMGGGVVARTFDLFPNRAIPRKGLMRFER